jgi:hypothetical protein
MEKKKQEKEEASKKYKKTKKQKFKSLCQRSQSGQSLVGKQMSCLLDKIKTQMNKK